MVSTDLRQPGGVASVLSTWKREGLFERWGVRHIATNSGATSYAKLWSCARAWAQGVWWMCHPGIGLVHVHTSSYVSFWRKSPFLLAAIVLRRRLIVSLHGGAFQDFYTAGGAIRRAWIRLILRKAVRFVVLTPAWANWVAAIEPRARVAVIPNPAPSVPTAPRPRSSEAPSTLLFLGRVEHAKGIDHLIAALAAAHAAQANWQLRIAGSGDVEAARRKALNAQIPNHMIEFVGWVDGPAKDALLDDCDMLVLPSLMENMPVVLLEAWARGRPVLATRVGGVPDMVDDGRDGWLVPAGDTPALAHALITAWRERDRLAAMGLAGHTKVSCLYAPNVVVAQVEALWQSAALTA